MSEVKVVAAFDFDGTLTRRDTLLPFLMRSLGTWAFINTIVKSSPLLIGFALRLQSNHVAKARLLELSFEGKSTQALQRHADLFVKEDLPGLWQPWAVERLLMHQRQGHLCVLVSASPDVYLNTAAASLNLDAVLCTEMEKREGQYTGKMASLNCHGEEKVRRLKLWMNQNLGDQASTILYAYGDTRGDLPMLRMAQHAFYRGRQIPNL